MDAEQVVVTFEAGVTFRDSIEEHKDCRVTVTPLWYVQSILFPSLALLKWYFHYMLGVISSGHFGCWEDIDNHEDVITAMKSFLSIEPVQKFLIHAKTSAGPLQNLFRPLSPDWAQICNQHFFVLPGLEYSQSKEVFNAGRTVWDHVEEHINWRVHFFNGLNHLISLT